MKAILTYLITILVLNSAFATEFDALLVGLIAYSDPSDSLKYCVNDVVDIRYRLLNDQNWDVNNISTLYNENATKQGIQSAIQALPRTAGHTTLYFHSGHGDSYELRIVNDLPYEQPYCDGLVPYDETNQYGEYRRITPSELSSWFGSNYNDYVCLLDACASGLFITGGLECPEPMHKGVIISASRKWEFAWEDPDIENGIFTHFLDEGLYTNNADPNGIVSAQELYLYSSPRTYDYVENCEELGPYYDQEPQLRINRLADLNLSAGSESDVWHWAGIVEISSDVTVPAGITITIEKGTVIEFQGDYKITVPATSQIIAIGDTGYNEEITFTSVAETAGSWQYVQLQGGNNVFEYCVFEYGDYPLYMNGCHANEGDWNRVENCTFRNNSNYGMYLKSSVAAIWESTFEDNGLYGVRCYDNDEIHFTGNIFQDNSSMGLYSLTDNLLKLYGNVIENNNGRGIYTGNGDYISIGEPYTWYGKNTIRENASEEVYAGSGNPICGICYSSLHDDSGYEIYNYSSNSNNVTALQVYWGSDSYCNYYGDVNNVNPVGSVPVYEGVPQTSGSPLNKLNVEFTDYPLLATPEKVNEYKQIIAQKQSIEKSVAALGYLYAIIRGDYLKDALREKEGFFEFLQNINNINSKNELGERALQYMMLWKILEDDYAIAAKLVEQVIEKADKDFKEILLFDLVQCYIGANDLKNAQSAFQNYLKECPGKKEEIALLLDDLELLKAQPEIPLFKTTNKNIEGFDLSQNYPNPANPTTTISYKLPDNGLVQLTIYNIQGQQVTTLVNAVQSSGQYNIVWNGTDSRGLNVSSGLYFFVINYQDIQLSKKFVLVR